MGEHQRETVHHGVHAVRANGGDCWSREPFVGFQAHRMERDTWMSKEWVWTNVAPVRETHEEAWQDMWDAGDKFHGEGEPTAAVG